MTIYGKVLIITSDRGVAIRYMKWWHTAHAIDQLKIVPRLMMLAVTVADVSVSALVHVARRANKRTGAFVSSVCICASLVCFGILDEQGSQGMQNDW